jgi:hypothetical protein
LRRIRPKAALAAGLALLATVLLASAGAETGPHGSYPILPGGSHMSRAEITLLNVDPGLRIVTVRFTATGPNAGFECDLSRLPHRGPRPHLSSCHSPLVYTTLRPGSYEFAVQAVAVSGASPGHPSSATRKLTVPIEFAYCFGAAARDPEHPCLNPSLRDVVVPTPTQAPLIPGYGDCTTGSDVGLFRCSFALTTPGERPNPRARPTIALIGDSHAFQYLAAMPTVARARRWYGVADIHLGCGFSEALMLSGGSYVAPCHSWSLGVLTWLWHERSITRVMISGYDNRSFATSAAAGFEQLWDAFPPWIRDIYVIRDGPDAAPGEAACVTRAIREHQPAGISCEQPRSGVLRDDQEADTAQDSGINRVHLIDLTPFFCSATYCFPVIGGALVLSDTNHITEEYVRALAPYLLRAIDMLG